MKTESLFAAPASGQTAPILDARSAEAIVTGCAADAAAKHQSEAIAVVDTGGHLIAALRMDGNGSGIFDFALAKAQASAAWGFSTAQMLQSARATPGFDRAPLVVIVPGGVPVFSAGEKSVADEIKAKADEVQATISQVQSLQRTLGSELPVSKSK